MNIFAKQRSRALRHRLHLVVLIVGMLFVVAACGDTVNTDTDTANAIDTDNAIDTNTSAPVTTDLGDLTEADNAQLNPEIVTAHNRLGMLIFADLTSRGANENVFLSPTSIALALGMTLNGADGETAQAIAEALQLAGLSKSQINESNHALLQSLLRDPIGDQSSPGIRLDIANSIWYRREFSIQQAFLDENRAYYDAQVESLDFDDPSSPDIINDWVSDATEGLIPGVVDQLDPDLVMMLINAVYFKGDWTTPFASHATRNLPFHLATGETRDLAMMYRDGAIDYYADERLQAVRLPYGDDERFAMYVFLPDEDVNITDFVADFTLDEMNAVFANFRRAQGELILPRIDISYKTKLNETLKALGMDIAFDAGRADFGNMQPENDHRNMYISDVIHQSVLKVDEEGTEATAVTSVDIRVTSMPMYEFVFQADRPFVLAIRDDETGAVVFTGLIMDPEN